MGSDGIGSIIGKVLIGVGAAVAGAYVANKVTSAAKQQNQPMQIENKRQVFKPSDYDDLLDFDEDYIGFAHVVWCRLLPAVAAVVSAYGLIDIRENKDELDRYVARITDNSAENDIQPEYIREFITATIDAVYNIQEEEAAESEEYGGTDIEGRYESLVDSIAEFVNSHYEDETRESVIYEMLSLTNKQNGAFCAALLDMAEAFELDQDVLTQILVAAGYPEDGISYPDMPYAPGDLDDICDFTDDPAAIIYFGNYDGFHVDLTRLVPAFSSLASMASGIDLRKNEELIQKYSTGFPGSYGILSDSMQDFVEATIDDVYSSDTERLKDIKNRIRSFLSRYNDSYARSIVGMAVLLTEDLDSAGWNCIYDIVKDQVSKEDLEYIVKEDPRYGDIDLGIVDRSLINRYLEVLGLGETATKKDVASAFKTLSLKVHPDTISSLGLNDEFTRFAQNRFIEIKEAYDYLIINM